MHAKTDSEVTSQTASTPPRSPPRRPVYYVQSPSRDSHDGEKTTTSFHSTPILSPTGSPPHTTNSSSIGHHSRESSSTRFSGSLKPGAGAGAGAAVGTGSRKIENGSKGRKHQQRWRKDQQQRRCDVIEEEGLLDDEDGMKQIPRRCYVLAFVLSFFVLFSFFALILFAAARPQKPVIAMKSVVFERFVVSAGMDATGVATEMASVNCSVRFVYRNTATFFGVHVTATPLDLSYSELTLANGNLKQFYQNRKSGRTMTVQVIGDKIPLYGSGSTLVGTTTGTPTAPVPLTLSFTVRSRAYVLGRLVKPKFYKRIQCSITLDPQKLTAPISLKNSCSYQ